MRRTASHFILMSTLLLAAACAKKTPEQLPPAPGETGAQSGDTDPWNQGAGSLRDQFVAEAGSDTVYFGTDSFSIDAEARAILEAQARWLVAHPNVNVTIEGHADERGTREYNLGLGDRRANAAKNFLASRGVSTARMSVVSWGKERPAALGSNETAWAQNRRAVTVLPSGF